MTYTKKQFLEDVKKEAEALKKHATDEELSRLNFNYLKPEGSSSCIYGQLTFNCRSPRASELIFKCCERYVDMPPEDSVYELPVDFDEMRRYINGQQVKGVSSAESFRETRRQTIMHFSSIEAYIMMPDAQNKNLIDFLKGTRKDLVL